MSGRKAGGVRSDSGTAASDIGLLYVGLDYRPNNNFVVGLLAQADWARNEDADDSVSARGRGWMIGPYLVARLHQNLIFDGRLAWGLSNNSVDPLGIYRDTFKGERWLAKAQLTGEFSTGMFDILPQVGVIYFEERQKAYTGSLGITIPSQTVSSGRVMFGPRTATSINTPGGATIAPYVSLKGVWNFDKTEFIDLDTGLAGSGSERLRARAEVGLNVALPDGTTVRSDAFYEGIGTKQDRTYGISIRVSVPLQTSFTPH